MAAPNMNGRLHLADAHQNSPASLQIQEQTDSLIPLVFTIYL